MLLGLARPHLYLETLSPNPIFYNEVTILYTDAHYINVLVDKVKGLPLNLYIVKTTTMVVCIGKGNN